MELSMKCLNLWDVVCMRCIFLRLQAKNDKASTIYESGSGQNIRVTVSIRCSVIILIKNDRFVVHLIAKTTFKSRTERIKLKPSLKTSKMSSLVLELKPKL